ncbi:hypothetical protein DL766_006876 [Monosporascus sp. MC13-8B]|uniref:Large ribosomal subunit protein uL29m n=1 Tax=Monosporascus cannonballus TaxID=155416 RepID=A0ABY0GTT5_9PEZI|nr:hypothetical protein DL762_009519 [Monosporascus cannonballus]RYO78609.1 hypothetical protein DL763_009573 [Monosporascus cannonballus]RYP25994.1 hypothetical protein DL766_006876 [Monosporascus sp. MC13-8B]
MRRPRRDNNRLRGLSSIYRSGPRFRMNVRKDEVPMPADYNPAADVQVDPKHGLWQFFYGRDKLLLTPEEDAEHGRGWTVEELRHKSWEDLHKLWWVCVKEQNRIATHRREKQNMRLKNGVEETAERLAEVRKTMKAIRHALTERYYLWEDARELAESDPEIDLSGNGEAYKPRNYFEAEEALHAEEQAVAEGSQEGQPLESELEPEKTGAERIDPSTLPSRPVETQQTTRP